MPQFEKLTSGEYERLAALGRENKRLQAFTNDDIQWVYIRAARRIEASLPTKVKDFMTEKRERPPGIIEADDMHIKRWEKLDYISLRPSTSLTVFILTPRGQDYLAYRAQSPIVRFVRDQWSDMRVEIRSAIISVVVALVTTYLSIRLGLIKLP